MSADSHAHGRKSYSTPVLHAYGSVMAVTRGSVGNKNDNAGAKKVG